jgi:molybdopterin-guanine dinucleotide biosynthesis protein
MYYWIATVKAHEHKGDTYVLRLAEDTEEAAAQSAKDNDLVAENETVVFERATLERVCSLLDFGRKSFVVLDQ